LLRVTFIMLFIMSVPPVALFAADQIDVKRDKDKTVYTIGQDGQIRQEEEKERDKAWEMLRNMSIIDKRKGQPSQGQHDQPTQSHDQPTQSK
jgi:hypothetical protein